MNIEELRSLRGIYRLVSTLDLPRPGPRELYNLLWMMRTRTNTQGSEKWSCPFDGSQLADWEAEVIHAVIANGNRLPVAG